MIYHVVYKCRLLLHVHLYLQLQLQSASPCRVQASNALPPAKHVYIRLRNSLQKDYATNKPSR